MQSWFCSECNDTFPTNKSTHLKNHQTSVVLTLQDDKETVEKDDEVKNFSKNEIKSGTQQHQT